MFGYWSASTHSGMTRSGPMNSASLRSQRMALSPPSANEVENRPRTMVFHLPTRTPPSESSGAPCSMSATSVVVPPMSTTTASSRPVSVLPPSAEAAGPDSRVSTACSAEYCSPIRLESERTIRISASMPRARKARVTAAMKSCVMGSRPALSTALAARSRLDRPENSSLEHTTGRPVCARRMSAAFFSSTPPLRVA